MKSEARIVDLGNGQEATVYHPSHYIDGSETYLIIQTHIDPSLDQVPKIIAQDIPSYELAEFFLESLKASSYSYEFYFKLLVTGEKIPSI